MQNKYRHIFFDLDGTLIDSGVGIINAVKYALNKYNINENNPAVLKSFVGPPLNQQFIDCYDFSEEQSSEAVQYFREYYSTTGILENNVYPQIPELLNFLYQMNFKLLIASSKPEKFVKMILAQHDLLKYFTFVGGSLFDGSRVNKDDVLSYVLTEMQIQKFDDCIMIGDRKYDILGAQKLGFTSVGVTYGYGERRELQEANADFLIDKPLELVDIII